MDTEAFSRTFRTLAQEEDEAGVDNVVEASTSQHDVERSANPDEGWTKISDLAERRRIQNRIAQRNYRKKLKRRLEDLERRAGSSSVSPPSPPRVHAELHPSDRVYRQAPPRVLPGQQNTPQMYHDDQIMFSYGVFSHGVEHERSKLFPYGPDSTEAKQGKNLELPALDSQVSRRYDSEKERSPHTNLHPVSDTLQPENTDVPGEDGDAVTKTNHFLGAMKVTRKANQSLEFYTDPENIGFSNALKYHWPEIGGYEKREKFLIAHIVAFEEGREVLKPLIKYHSELGAAAMTETALEGNDQDDYPGQSSQYNKPGTTVSELTATAPSTCTNFCTQITPLWKTDLEGHLLCNTCGLFHELNGIARPLSLETDVIKKYNHGSFASSIFSSKDSRSTMASSVSGNSKITILHRQKNSVTGLESASLQVGSNLGSFRKSVCENHRRSRKKCDPEKCPDNALYGAITGKQYLSPKMQSLEDGPEFETPVSYPTIYGQQVKAQDVANAYISPLSVNTSPEISEDSGVHLSNSITKEVENTGFAKVPCFQLFPLDREETHSIASPVTHHSVPTTRTDNDMPGMVLSDPISETAQSVYPEDRPPSLDHNRHIQQYAHMSVPSTNINIKHDASSQTSNSSATTSITVPDTDSDSENDSADLSSDPELYDEPREQRILNPKSYFEDLAALEREIFQNSGIRAYKTGISNNHDDDHQFLQLPTVSLPLVGIDSEAIIPLIRFTKSEKLLHLWETYNLSVRIWKNLVRLRNFGFCGPSISLLTKDHDRTNVAKIIQVDIQPILSFVQDIEDILGATSMAISKMQIAKATRWSVNRYIAKQDQELGLTTRSLDLLVSMGLLPHLLLNDEPAIIWQCAFQTLDMVVLAYAGSHTQRFDLDLMGCDIEAFKLPRRYVYHDEIFRQIASDLTCQSIIFRRRRLQCVDKLLGKKEPWIIHQNFSNNGDDRLCLSTSIEALTDLWGPSWKILNNSDPELIKQFDIGNGAIVPWSANNENQHLDIEVYPSEVFCHWVASGDWNASELESRQSSLSRKHFLKTDTLLVGASSDFGLLVNEKCNSSLTRLSSIKTKLDQQGGLRTRNTYRSQRYIDSHAVQIQGTVMGAISGAGIITYKRREGHTMKDALVERWRHKLRNPMDLEAFSGVEISLCTGNARRRRLLHLLGSPTIRNYLSGIAFPWLSEECENSYFKALRCPKSFRKFWKSRPDYRENIGDAISTCLDALEETGVNEESRELRGFWVESFDDGGDSDGESDGGTNDGEDQESLAPIPRLNFFEEWIVTLFRSEYTWTGFLEDSEESLTMAVVGSYCLDFNTSGGYGRRCTQAQCTLSSRGYPVLQTSLQLNESILKGEKLKREKLDAAGKVAWDAKDVKKGSSFSLGNHGTLKVLTASSNTCPMIMEWSAVKSETLKEVKNIAINEKLLGRNPERHHREHIRGTWEYKPLPVLVLSKSTKVAFSGH